MGNGMGLGIEWYGISYEEKQAGAQANLLYALSVLVVFLSLAALYESWAVPFAVMLVVPLGVLGAATAAYLFKLPNDVFLQVALLTTVGLASKNAILIVEFAKHLREQGASLLEAVSLAARQRFRPIIMTSMAFTMGVMPLALATGAGAASQNLTINHISPPRHRAGPPSRARNRRRAGVRSIGFGGQGSRRTCG